MVGKLGKAVALIVGLALLGLAALYFISNVGTTVVHLQCDGTVRERLEDSDLLANRARLGLTFEKFDATVFWAEEKKRYSLT